MRDDCVLRRPRWRGPPCCRLGMAEPDYGRMPADSGYSERRVSRGESSGMTQARIAFIADGTSRHRTDCLQPRTVMAAAMSPARRLPAAPTAPCPRGRGTSPRPAARARQLPDAVNHVLQSLGLVLHYRRDCLPGHGVIRRVVLDLDHVRHVRRVRPYGGQLAVQGLLGRCH
jgi:hypothetical protein